MVTSPAAPTRLARRRDRRKAEIVREAIRLLAANGYQAVSLEQVAEQADIAKATLYHYFSSKDELVSAALDALTVGVMDRLEAVHAATATLSCREQLRALSGEQLNVLLGEYPEVGTIFSWQGWWPEVHDEARKSMRRRHDAIFRDVIEAGMAGGEFHCEDLDVALQCHHAIMSNVSSWIGQIDDPTAAAHARDATLAAVMRVVAADRD
jgi:TetR/AcrR family transcriptional regulator of autoinduction and epiphytic fitness